MAIATISPKYFLGSFIPNVKILSAKVDEIINYINGTQVAVTQGTSITTGVTANATKGVITTVSLTTAASTVAGPFVVTNSKVTTSSIVQANVEYATGKTGFPVCLIEAVAAGSFNVRLLNASTGAALNDVVKIHFDVIN
jgi:hypothetical protein